MNKKHTAEGFKRDILPILEEKGKTLVSMRYSRESGIDYDNRSFPQVCLLGALDTAKADIFTPEQKSAMEAGFEGWGNRKRKDYYYRLGATIAKRFAKEKG